MGDDLIRVRVNQVRDLLDDLEQVQDEETVQEWETRLDRLQRDLEWDFGHRDVSDEYNDLLDYMVENANGVGPQTREAIVDEFPNGEDFIESCKTAFFEQDAGELTNIDGIAVGIARGELAHRAAEFFGWKRDVDVEVFNP